MMKTLEQVIPEIRELLQLNSFEFLTDPTQNYNTILKKIRTALKHDLKLNNIKITDSSNPKHVIYSWKLEGGFYYVGLTKNLPRRSLEHITGEGSNWTKLHKPIKLIELKINGDEYCTTIEYMKKYGIHNVRGAKFVKDTISYDEETEIEQYWLDVEGIGKSERTDRSINRILERLKERI